MWTARWQDSEEKSKKSIGQISNRKVFFIDLGIHWAKEKLLLVFCWSFLIYEKVWPSKATAYEKGTNFTCAALKSDSSTYTCRAHMCRNCFKKTLFVTRWCLYIVRKYFTFNKSTFHCMWQKYRNCLRLCEMVHFRDYLSKNWTLSVSAGFSGYTTTLSKRIDCSVYL